MPSWPLSSFNLKKWLHYANTPHKNQYQSWPHCWYYTPEYYSLRYYLNLRNKHRQYSWACRRPTASAVEFNNNLHQQYGSTSPLTYFSFVLVASYSVKNHIYKCSYNIILTEHLIFQINQTKKSLKLKISTNKAIIEIENLLKWFKVIFK